MIALLTLWSLFDIFVFIYVTATLDPDLSIDYIRLFVLTAICGHLTWITACGLIIIKLLVDFLKITSTSCRFLENNIKLGK